MSDVMDQRTEVDRTSVQTVRNVLEISGKQTFENVINDLSVLWTPGVGDELTINPLNGRVGIYVDVMNVSSVEGIVTDGTTSWPMTGGSSSKFLKTKDAWVQPFPNPLNLTNIPTDYYAPVAGEESMGTLCHLSSERISSYLRSGALTALSYTDVDVSSYVPLGAKGVLLTVFGENASGNAIISIAEPESTSGGNYQSYQTFWNYAAGEFHSCALMPKLSPNRKFTLYNLTAWNTLFITLEGYYI